MQKRKLQGNHFCCGFALVENFFPIKFSFLYFSKSSLLNLIESLSLPFIVYGNFGKLFFPRIKSDSQFPVTSKNASASLGVRNFFCSNFFLLYFLDLSESFSYEVIENLSHSSLYSLYLYRDL